MSSSLGSSGSLSTSKELTGEDWQDALFFTPDAQKPGPEAKKISDDELLSYFEKVDGIGEQIEKVYIYKHNLSSWVPMWFGLWHEFTVVKTKNWYWSFERDTKGIIVQRSKDWDSVQKMYRGEERIGNLAAEGRPSQRGRIGDTLLDVFGWIHQEDFLHQRYHLTKTNCHYFASLLFEAIACQEGRRLKNLQG